MSFRQSLRDLLRQVHRGESGQVAIEYLLATGALAVVVAAGLIAGFEVIVPQILNTLCDAVDPLGSGDCLSF